MKVRYILSLAAAISIICNVTNAGILVSQVGTGWPYNGYNGENWDLFSSMLDSASGGTVEVTPNLETAAQVMAADALWVDQRYGGDLLSASEVENIQNFVATGKRVVLIGENGNWASWNAQITSLLGGSSGDTFYQGFFVPLVSHDLTQGVSSIYLAAGGSALGGSPLFDINVASLYGPSNNALVIMDSTVMADNYISVADNAIFSQNIANWVAVPEPSSLAFIGVIGCGAFGIRRFFLI